MLPTCLEAVICDGFLQRRFAKSWEDSIVLFWLEIPCYDMSLGVSISSYGGTLDLVLLRTGISRRKKGMAHLISRGASSDHLLGRSASAMSSSMSKPAPYKGFTRLPMFLLTIRIAYLARAHLVL